MKKDIVNKTSFILVEGQQVKLPEGEYAVIDTEIIDIKDGKARAKKVGKQVVKYAKKGVKKTVKIVVKKQNRFVAFLAIIYNVFFSNIVRVFLTSASAIAIGLAVALPITLTNDNKENEVVPSVEPIQEQEQNNNPPVINVTNISLNKREATINVDDEETLTYTISPEDASNKNVVWSVNDSTVIEIDQTGKCKGLKAGEAKVTCTTVDGNKTAECNFKVEQPDPLRYCMKATNTSDDSIELTYTVSNATTVGTPVYYSLDGEQWSTLSSNGLILGKDEYAYFKSSLTPDNYHIGTMCFKRDGEDYDAPGIALSGTIMSLLYGESPTDEQLLTIPEGVSFNNLFIDSTAITSIDENFLPAINLPAAIGEHEGVYSWMFSGCMGLKKAPKLPALTVPTYGYSYMFALSGLTECPLLPATTLDDYAYAAMFMVCESITDMPKINAEQLGVGSLCITFCDCPNLVNLQPKVCEANTMTEEACEGMFESSGVTSIPAGFLPATKLDKECYRQMFKECANLVDASITLPAESLAESCYDTMFSKCINLTKAPYLPATTLADGCYYEMFINCESLEIVTSESPEANLIFKCPVFNEQEIVLPIEDMFKNTKNWTEGNPEQGKYYSYSLSTNS